MGNFGIKNVSKTEKIGLAEYLSYGLGDFSFCFIYGAIGSYMVFFYTDVACISAATVGTIMLLSKIFDAFSDLLMGYIIEHVHSPLGKVLFVTLHSSEFTFFKQIKKRYHINHSDGFCIGLLYVLPLCYYYRVA